MDPPGTRKVSACATFVRWTHLLEDEGSTYTVRMLTAWDPRLRVDFSYSCDCQEYRSEPGPCVHVLMARGFHCGWHEMFDPERRSGEGACPRCGGPTAEVLYTPE